MGIAERDRPVLLVPTDFGEPSLRALSTARELAPLLGAEIVLVHVHGTPVYAYPSGQVVPIPRLQEEIARAARRSLDELAATFGGLHAILREGHVATQVLRVIDETKPIMVVLGTHARRGLSRLLFGSVTEEIIERSPCPVLAVARRAHPTARCASFDITPARPSGCRGPRPSERNGRG